MQPQLLLPLMRGGGTRVNCMLIVCDHTYRITEAAQLSLLCPTCRYENECECQLLLRDMLKRLNKVS